MKNLSTCLWFDNNAEEAVDFYMSVFSDAEVIGKTYWGEAGPGPAGTVMTIPFRIKGQDFLAVNGGPYFTFSPAISLIVPCDSQDEIDMFWDKLSDGGSQEQCGWLKDKFGLSWQIVPSDMGDMMLNPDRNKAERVFKEVLTMIKLDHARLQKAYAG